jgi:tetratricopeptide (TPR) repeat protein
MRKIFESVISVIVALISLGLCTKWYLNNHEIEPLIGIVASVGVLLTAAAYRIFPEKKEDITPPIVIEHSKNIVLGSTFTVSGDMTIGERTIETQQNHSGEGDNIAGDKNITIINEKDKLPRFLTGKPFKTDFFIGRDTDLAAIEADYLQNNHLLVLVNGEGGMGKTTLAAQYWFKHEDRYTHLAWMFADSGVGNSLLSLASNLGVTFSPQDDETAQITRITEGINNLKSPCLFVFDNANKADDLEKHFGTLRRLSNCHILLTSRVTALEDVPVHRVLPLDKDFAVQLFTKYYPKYATEVAGSETLENPSNLLQNLLHAVGYNTLVIELLAKNLAVFNKFQTQYSLQSLVTDLQERGLFAVQGKAVKTLYQADSLRTETPDNIIAAMYDVSALSDAERFLLNNFAVLPAENISYAVLIQLLQPTEADIYDAPLSSLQQKGWIDFYETSNDFKISPVIQHITKRKNAATLLNDCATLIQTLKNELHPDNIHEDNYKMSTVFARFAETVVSAFETPQYNAALLCELIGTYYRTVGNLDRAIAFYEKCSTISKELCVLQPDNEYNINGLAISYEKLGETHTALGNLSSALNFFEQCNQLETVLHEAFPQNMEFKKNLAISYQFLGNTHTALGNLSSALNFFEQFSNLIKELHEAFPQNVSFKNGLASSYSKLGSIHIALGNLSSALHCFEQFNNMIKELHEAFPQNVSFKNGLAISYSKLGSTQAALGNLNGALNFFEQDIELSKELHQAFLQNVSFKNGLAISFAKLGETHTSLGNLDKALGFYEEYNRLEAELYVDYPNNVEFKNGLAISYEKLGSMHTALGNLNKASGFYEERNRLSKELYAAYPNNVSFKNGLAISYQYLGITHMALDNLDKALGFYEDYIKLSKELYAAYPNIVEFKNGLALSYQSLGWFFENKKKNKQKAKECYQASEKLLIELVTSFPIYVEFNDNLKWVQDMLKALD